MSQRPVHSLPLLLSLVVASCSLLADESDEVGRPVSTRVAFAEQWAATILDIGRFPILPPTADIYVGDVFALSSPPNESSARTAGGLRSLATPRWKTLDVRGLLSDEARERAAAPGTAGEVDSGSSGRTDRRRAPQRSVGVRALANLTVDLPDLEPFLPIEIAPLVDGPASSDRLAVSVQVGSADVDSLSLSVLLDQLVERTESGDFLLRNEHVPSLSLVANPETRLVYLQVVSEVLYARNVDVTVRTRAPTPLPDDPRRRRGANGEDDGTADSILIPGPPLPAEEDFALAALERAASMNDAFDVIVGEDAYAAAMKILMATDDAITLRRTWPAPLGFAVRGVTLEVEVATGRVRRMGPLGVALPELPKPKAEGAATEPVAEGE